MSGTSNPKKDLADFDGQTARVRKQFTEQMAFLDARTTGKVELLSDLQEYFKKRAEIEAAYASNLEKLTERMANKRPQTTRREPTSTHNLMASLLSETKAIARERHQLYDMFSGEFCPRLDGMIRDVQQISRKVRELLIFTQDDLKKSFSRLLEDVRTYAGMCNQTADAEEKLKKTKGKKLPGTNLDSRASLRRKKHEDKAFKAGEMLQVARKRRNMSRNKYFLSLSSSNHAMERFFNCELLEFSEVLDYDYHAGLGRLCDTYVNSEISVADTVTECMRQLRECVHLLSFDSDKHKLMEEHCSAFSPPGLLPQVHFQDDNVCHLSLHGAPDERDSYKQLKERLEKIQFAVQEEETAVNFVKDTLGHKKLGYEDAVTSSSFDEENATSPPYLSLERKTGSLDRNAKYSLSSKHERTASGNYIPESSSKSLNLYLEKFQSLKQYQMELYHLEAEKSVWDKVMDGRDLGDDILIRPMIKLFESDLEQYIEAVSEPIPLIIVSCANHLETYGVVVEGIFRVPGPQALIEELKEEFEKGEDPLSSEPQSRDIHAVASVMKEYFRKLNNSLFPVELYETVVQQGRIDSLKTRVESIRQSIYKELSPSIVNVMRYLFHFLCRLSKFHEQTRMTSSNLAMVFGPTLTRPPAGRDPLTQAQEVVSINIIMQTCIEHWEEIFELPKEEPLADQDEDNQETPSEDEVLDNSDNDTEDLLSEMETIEVRALHDFKARSDSELSFAKGTILHAIQLTDNGSWYDGLLGRKRGYFPSKYVEEIPLDMPSSTTSPPSEETEREPEAAPAPAPATEPAAEAAPAQAEAPAAPAPMPPSPSAKPASMFDARQTDSLTRSFEEVEAELAEIALNLDIEIGSVSSPPQRHSLSPQEEEDELKESKENSGDPFPSPPEPVAVESEPLSPSESAPPAQNQLEVKKKEGGSPFPARRQFGSLPTVPLPYAMKHSISSLPSPTSQTSPLVDLTKAPPQVRPKPKFPDPATFHKSPSGSRKYPGSGSLPSTPTGINIFGQIVGAAPKESLSAIPSSREPAKSSSSEGLLKDRPVIKAKPISLMKSPKFPVKPLPYKKPTAHGHASALAQQAALAAEGLKSRVRMQNAEMESRDRDVDEEGVTHL